MIEENSFCTSLFVSPFPSPFSPRPSLPSIYVCASPPPPTPPQVWAARNLLHRPPPPSTRLPSVFSSLHSLTLLVSPVIPPSLFRLSLLPPTLHSPRPSSLRSPASCLSPMVFPDTLHSPHLKALNVGFCHHLSEAKIISCLQQCRLHTLNV